MKLSKWMANLPIGAYQENDALQAINAASLFIQKDYQITNASVIQKVMAKVLYT